MSNANGLYAIIVKFSNTNGLLVYVLLMAIRPATAAKSREYELIALNRLNPCIFCSVLLEAFLPRAPLACTVVYPWISEPLP